MGAIPLGDESRRPTRFPVVTPTIVAVNALVIILELSGGDAFVDRWSLVPSAIMAGCHGTTILTAMFMHGSWSHHNGNTVFLWSFGPEIEDLMTAPPYLLFYLVGGMAATVAKVPARPDSTVPNLAASGASAAVMGAFPVTRPCDRIRSILVIFIFLRVPHIPAAFLIGVWVLTQFLNLDAVASQQAAGGVAYAAHVGGFIFGAVTAPPFFQRRSRAVALHRID